MGGGFCGSIQSLLLWTCLIYTYVVTQRGRGLCWYALCSGGVGMWLALCLKSPMPTDAGVRPPVSNTRSCANNPPHRVSLRWVPTLLCPTRKGCWRWGISHASPVMRGISHVLPLYVSLVLLWLVKGSYDDTSHRITKIWPSSMTCIPYTPYEAFTVIGPSSTLVTYMDIFSWVDGGSSQSMRYN